MSNITIEKNVEGLKRLFSLKENLKKCSSFERAKRYKIYSRKRLLWYYRLQLSFVYKTVSQIYSNLFCSGDKSLLSEFFRKWGWFHGHNERLPKYLCQKLKLQKLRHAFVDERAMILTTPISSCHWKTLLLAKEKTWRHIFDTNSESSPLYRKTNCTIQNNNKLTV